MSPDSFKNNKRKTLVIYKSFYLKIYMHEQDLLFVRVFVSILIFCSKNPELVIQG